MASGDRLRHCCQGPVPPTLKFESIVHNGDLVAVAVPFPNDAGADYREIEIAFFSHSPTVPWRFYSEVPIFDAIAQLRHCDR